MDNTMFNERQILVNQQLLGHFFRKMKDLTDSYAETRSNIETVITSLAGKRILIHINDIIYFKAEDKYIVVKHNNGKSIMNSSLLKLEKGVGSKFIRIHRNALVAKARIIGYEKTPTKQFRIILDKEDEWLSVSRRHIPEVRRMFHATPTL